MALVEEGFVGEGDVMEERTLSSGKYLQRSAIGGCSQ